MTNKSIESEAQLAPKISLHQRVKTLNEMAWGLINSNPRQALHLSNKAIALNQDAQSDDPQMKADYAQSLINLSASHYRLSDYPAALQTAQEALAYYQSPNDPINLTNIYNIISLVYLNLGDYPIFLEYALQGLEMSRLSEQRHFEAILLNNIGYAYLQLAQPQQALPHLKESLTIAQEIGEKSSQGDACDNLCLAFCMLSDYETALQYGNQSLDFYKEAGNKIGYIESLRNLGDVFFALNQFDHALDNFHQAMTASEEMGDQLGCVESLLRLSTFYKAQHKHMTALALLQQALAISEKIKAAKAIYQCHLLMAQIYKSLENFEQALHHYEQYHLAHTQVFNDVSEARQQTLEVFFKLETAHRTADLYQLKNVTLEKEIAKRERIEQLLREQNDELDAFAHTVAHDLKNPMATILNLADMFQTYWHTLPPEQLDEIADMMVMTGHKATKIIESLLFLASVRKEDVTVQPIDMAYLIASVQQDMAPMIEKCKATISVASQDWPTAWGHSPWLEQVWANYISNGLKYGGNPPHLTLGATVQADSSVQFWVHDNGPGITSADQGLLFKEFARLGNQRMDSHGLGLAIVRRIINKLDGEVGVDSKLGQGSRFYFTLPLVNSETDQMLDR